MSCSPHLNPDQLEKALAFHGHSCPGLSYGLRAAAWIVAEMGTASDEELVTLTETDMCAVDAIQALVGCTFGKGNLIHLPYGKVAFTVFRRRDGRSVRLALNPHARERLLLDPALPKEQARQALIEAILRAPFEELFCLGPALQAVPPRARIEATLICDACGEGVMESRIRLREGRRLCLPCRDAGR